jgi:ankyrin repeat protein
MRTHAEYADDGSVCDSSVDGALRKQNDLLHRCLTALHVAATEGHWDIVAISCSDLDRKNSKGQTAFHAAATTGQKDIVALLIEKRASVDHRMDHESLNETDGESLHFAVLGGLAEIARILISAGSDIDRKNN